MQAGVGQLERKCRRRCVEVGRTPGARAAIPGFVSVPELTSTVVHATDRHVSAEFLARILGVPVQPAVGPFVPVTVANDVTLDLMEILTKTPGREPA